MECPPKHSFLFLSPIRFEVTLQAESLKVVEFIFFFFKENVNTAVDIDKVVRIKRVKFQCLVNYSFNEAP